MESSLTGRGEDTPNGKSDTGAAAWRGELPLVRFCLVASRHAAFCVKGRKGLRPVDCPRSICVNGNGSSGLEAALGLPGIVVAEFRPPLQNKKGPAPTLISICRFMPPCHPLCRCLSWTAARITPAAVA